MQFISNKFEPIFNETLCKNISYLKLSFNKFLFSIPFLDMIICVLVMSWSSKIDVVGFSCSQATEVHHITSEESSEWFLKLNLLFLKAFSFLWLMSRSSNLSSRFAYILFSIKASDSLKKYMHAFFNTLSSRIIYSMCFISYIIS